MKNTQTQRTCDPDSSAMAPRRVGRLLVGRRIGSYPARCGSCSDAGGHLKSAFRKLADGQDVSGKTPQALPIRPLGRARGLSKIEPKTFLSDTGTFSQHSACRIVCHPTESATYSDGLCCVQKTFSGISTRSAGPTGRVGTSCAPPNPTAEHDRTGTCPGQSPKVSAIEPVNQSGHLVWRASQRVPGTPAVFA